MRLLLSLRRRNEINKQTFSSYSSRSPCGLPMVMFMLLSIERPKSMRDCWVKLYMKMLGKTGQNEVLNQSCYTKSRKKYDINKSLFALLFTAINKIKVVK